MKIDVPVKIGKMAGKHFVINEETGKVLSRGYEDRSDAVSAVTRIVAKLLSKVGVSEDFHNLPKKYREQLNSIGLGDEED